MHRDSSHTSLITLRVNRIIFTKNLFVLAVKHCLILLWVSPTDLYTAKTKCWFCLMCELFGWDCENPRDGLPKSRWITRGLFIASILLMHPSSLLSMFFDLSKIYLRNPHLSNVPVNRVLTSDIHSTITSAAELQHKALSLYLLFKK